MKFIPDEFYVVEATGGSADHFVGMFVANHPVLEMTFIVHGIEVDGIWVRLTDPDEFSHEDESILIAAVRNKAVKSAKRVVRANPDRMPNRGDFPISLFDIGWVVDSDS